jgi:hypothetical protein
MKMRAIFGIIQIVFLFVLVGAASIAPKIDFIMILLFWIGVTLVFGFMLIDDAVRGNKPAVETDAARRQRVLQREQVASS